jgi:isopentenyldiphosphate isomerase/mannose-6-phosphate isomerase-like protein (cupin superfamily)
MTAQDVIAYLQKEYPGKEIVCLPDKNPTEILCEIEPSTDHADYSVAVAAIKSSAPHHHNKSVETYEVIKGELELYVDGKMHQLAGGESYTIQPSQIHYAKGDFTLVKVTSHPGWTLEDHILAHRIVVVNDQDEVIGYKKRGTLNQEDIYRVSALWVTNPNGDILLAQRHHTKKHHPNLWGPAVAGTIDEGETYDENIVKEAEEEIGLKNIQPKKSQKIRATGEHNHFTQWYTLTCDKSADDFVIQEDEVEQVKWFTRAELARELQEHPEKYLLGTQWNLENL